MHGPVLAGGVGNPQIDAAGACMQPGFDLRIAAGDVLALAREFEQPRVEFDGA